MPRKDKRKRPLPDEIRRRILEVLYKKHRESGQVKKYLITELRRLLKEELGLTPAEISHNLDYLIQSEWIVKMREPYTGRAAQAYGTKRETHRISSKGIDLFEGGSPFSMPESYHAINVSGERNIVQVGFGNYANVKYQDLQMALESLLQGVVISEDISAEHKVQTVADVKSIQSQLLKPEQDETLLNRIKGKLEWLGNIGGLSSLWNMVMQHWPF